MFVRLRARGQDVVRVALVLPLALFLASCDLPRDPHGTLERARHGMIRVGIAPNTPFTHLEEGRPGGLEVALVRAFADSLGAEILWVPGGLPDLLTALREYELDVVLAGLTARAPGLAGLATTNSYLTTRIIVAVPPSPPSRQDLTDEDLAGREVAAPVGSRAAALLKRRGAAVVPVDDPFTAAMPIAVPDWQANRQGYRPTRIELAAEAHVMVVPPGENAWLVALERFLHDHREEARRRLWTGQF